jgi:putative membrane protein
LVRMLISIAIKLGANAIGLILAALILANVSINAGAFIVALLIFTGVEVIAEPVLHKAAMGGLRLFEGGVALIATFVGLVVTDFFSIGLSIHGVTTWLLATLVVWLGAVLGGLVLPALFLKDRVDDRRSGRK